jgi:hypothetical protein
MQAGADVPAQFRNQLGLTVPPPELEIAAATTNSNNRGTMTPPADDDVAAATTSGSITGSTTPPAKAVVVASDKAVASAMFFIQFSNFICWLT